MVSLMFKLQYRWREKKHIFIQLQCDIPQVCLHVPKSKLPFLEREGFC